MDTPITKEIQVVHTTTSQPSANTIILQLSSSSLQRSQHCPQAHPSMDQLRLQSAPRHRLIHLPALRSHPVPGRSW
jgi:hypothetical protein